MVGTYNSGVVLLSFLVAVLASYTALDLASRITASRGVGAAVWLAGGAFAMGTGVWSMHFIGMLALPPAHRDGLPRRHHAAVDADRDHRFGLRALHGLARIDSACGAWPRAAC